MSLEAALVKKEPECSEADHDHGPIKEGYAEQVLISMKQKDFVQPISVDQIVSVKQEPVCVKQEHAWDTASSSMEHDSFNYEVKLEPIVLPIETFYEESTLSIEPLEDATAHEAVEVTELVPLNAYSVQHTGGINIYVCYTCGTICKEEHSIIEHIMVSRHLPGQNTTAKRYKKAKKFENHIPGTPYTCAKCKKEFTTKFRFQQHQLLHSGKRLFTCDVCHYIFTQASNFESHKRVHNRDTKYTMEGTGKKPYACKECDKNFNEPFILKKHTATHSRTKVYSCEICKANFLISNHKIEQNEEKPFACKECDQKFSQEGHLKRYRTRGSRNS